MARRFPGGFVAALGLTIFGIPAFPAAAHLHAQPADGVQVRVEISGIDGALLRNVEALAGIVRASRSRAVRPGHVYRLHDKAPETIERALQPFGYYHPKIQASLDTESTPWVARYVIDPGPPVMVERLDIRIIGEAETDSAFQAALGRITIAEGDTLSHPAYERARTSLDLLAADRGYLDAVWDSSFIRVDLERNRSEIVLHLTSGPRFRFGDVSIDQEWVDVDILEPHIGFQPGDPFDSSFLRDLQSNLSGTTYFANVEIVPRRDLAADDLRVPIEIRASARKTQRWEAGVGYGTDTGPRIRLATEFRRLNRRGHFADGDARLSTTEQSITARYNIPVGFPNPSLWTLTGRYGRIEWTTSKTIQGFVGLSYAHLRGEVREVLALRYQEDDFTVAADTGVSRLTQPIASWTFSDADNRLYATRGIGGVLELRGALDGFGSSASFFRAWTSLKAIQGLSPRIRAVVRGDAGWISTEQFRQLPPSIRFFAGGDRSIRGYDYQSLGPVNENGDVTGGNSLLVGTAELEYRILEKWSGAVFLDAGNALRDFRGEVAVGTGFGARWISPVGLVRVDVGFGLQKEGNPVRLHLSIGPDF
ncbi:MAG: autotransporter assembly complex protein TamA [marine benthic group bacterium]|nr:autotransporter assembly complex protein TamA [Candidatus Benthicola marisminoris]